MNNKNVYTASTHFPLNRNFFSHNMYNQENDKLLRAFGQLEHVTIYPQ